MTTLKKTCDRPGVDTFEVRESLYFGKYKYRATMYISGLRKSYSDSNTYLIDTQTINNFNGWCVLQSSENKKKVKIRIEGSNASIFSNDLDILLSLNNCYSDDTKKVEITEIIKNGNNEIKYYINKPKHNYRMYFKSHFLPRKSNNSNIISDVLNILKDYQGRVFPSWKLKREINRQDRYIYFYGCYIDLDDETDLSFILMKYDHLFNKVYKLEKLPEIQEMINTL